MRGSGKSAKSRERTKLNDYEPVKRRVFPVEDLVSSSEILHEIHFAAKQDKSNLALTLIEEYSEDEETNFMVPDEGYHNLLRNETVTDLLPPPSHYAPTFDCFVDKEEMQTPSITEIDNLQSERSSPQILIKKILRNEREK